MNTDVSIQHSNIHPGYRTWVNAQSPNSTSEVVWISDRMMIQSQETRALLADFLKCMGKQLT